MIYYLIILFDIVKWITVMTIQSIAHFITILQLFILQIKYFTYWSDYSHSINHSSFFKNFPFRSHFCSFTPSCSKPTQILLRTLRNRILNHQQTALLFLLELLNLRRALIKIQRNCPLRTKVQSLIPIRLEKPLHMTIKA